MTGRDFSGGLFISLFPSWLSIALGLVLLFYSDNLAAEEKPDVPPPDTSSEELFFKLSADIQRLRNVRVVAADRSEERYLPDLKPKFIVSWHDIFLNGDHAQVRSDWVLEDRPKWREGGKSSNIPLTHETVSEYSGLIICSRPEGEAIHAEIGHVAATKKVPYSLLYAAYSTTRRPVASAALPFFGVGRTWNGPELATSGSSLLVDHLIKTDYRSWIGPVRDHTLKVPAIKVVILVSDEPYSPKLSRHDGVLQMWSVWNVWFTDDANHFPIRMQSSRRYVYKDKEVPLIWQGEGRYGPVYVAGEYQDYGNGLWYPASGSEVSYAVDPGSPVVIETPDDIVDEYLREGHYRMKSVVFPAGIREWQILTLEDLPATSQLWIEPPNGALLHKVDSHTEEIVGKTVAESQRILGNAGQAGAYSRPIVSPHGQSTNRMIFLGANALLAVALAVYCLRKWGKSGKSSGH